MSWFDTNAPQPALPAGGSLGTGFDENGQPMYGTPSPVNRTDPNNPNVQLLGSGSGPTMTPSGGAAGGTDYKSQFMAIMGGLPATPENLASKEKELQAAGFRVVRSGDGTAGKVAVPGGAIFDVIQGAHAGGGGSWQWLGGDSGGGGSLGSMGNFQTGTFTGGGQYPLASVMGTGLAQPWTTPFNAPDPNSVTNDKALQWQMGRGIDAIQRSAAAKGTLLTGGLEKKLDEWGQGLASTYYGDVYNRALNEYRMAHDIYTGNQDSLYSRLAGVAGLGQNAAANMGNAAGAYGQGASNTMLGIGNAQAGGTAAGGAAWGNAVGNLGNIAASSYQQTHQPQFNPYTGGTYPAFGNPDYVQGTGYPSNG